MNIFRVLKDYKQFEIFILGMLSGMPLAIIFSTLSVWLADYNIPLEIITTFAIARLSYSAKFLWAPIVDFFKFPYLGKFGHRKSWMIFCASSMTIILFLMSRIDPITSLPKLYVLVITLGFFSATFDISFDAFRIERFSQNLQGVTAANTVFGYRMGMLITGAWALYYAHVTGSWSKTFMTLSFIFAGFVTFLIFVKEAIIERVEINKLTFGELKKMVVNPYKDFLIREGAILILLAVVLFKLGDAMLGVVSMPFYRELGYDKQQIAFVVKGVGLVATILGTYAGGFVIYKIGSYKGLVVTGIVQSITHLAFIWLNHQDVSNKALMVAITVENFGSGMGAAALVAYLSNLCNKKYSASQYALLSSLTSFFNNTVTVYGGSLVRAMGWDNYFYLTMVLAIPGIVLFMYLNKRYPTAKMNTEV